MELYQHWEETTEATREDAAQLRRDNKYHARTSYESLVFFTKQLAVNGSFNAVNQLSELGAWLSAHQSEVPAEIEDAKGNRSWGSRIDTPAKNEGDFDAMLDKARKDDSDEVYPDEEIEGWGMYNVGDHVAYQSLDNIGRAMHEYRAEGKTTRVYLRLMWHRGLAFKRQYKEKLARLRWRGMEEFGGVTKALAYMDANVSPRAAQSGSAPLPTQAELHDLFNYDGLTLTWAVSRGRIRKGKPVQPRVKINGTNYYAGRLVWMHRTGEDPASATISHVDGDNTNLSWSNLRIERLATKSGSAGVDERVRKLDDSNWRARFWIERKPYALGEYNTQEQAERAYELAMRTFQRFA